MVWVLLSLTVTSSSRIRSVEQLQRGTSRQLGVLSLPFSEDDGAACKVLVLTSTKGLAILAQTQLSQRTSAISAVFVAALKSSLHG